MIALPMVSPSPIAEISKDCKHKLTGYLKPCTDPSYLQLRQQRTWQRKPHGGRGIFQFRHTGAGGVVSESNIHIFPKTLISAVLYSFVGFILQTVKKKNVVY